MTYYNQNEYLSHHGIKGQKWGVRRYQDSSGALTEAGRKRYGVGVREGKDLVIKKGTKMQTITSNPNFQIPDRMYASYRTTDKIKYKGQYGALVNKRNKIAQNGGKVYSVTNVATKTLTAPSHKTAENVFNHLYQTNKEFKDSVDEAFDRWNNQPERQLGRKTLFRTVTNDSKEIPMNKKYDAFNITLTDHDYKAGSIYYDKLKSMGYNSLLDMNDSKYGGYHAKAPMIIFDTNNALAKESINEVSMKEIRLNQVADVTIRTGQRYLPVAMAAVGGAVLISNALKHDDITLETPNDEDRK